MSKRTYEDSTQAERLEQQTASSLTQGWTLWNSNDFLVVVARLILPLALTGSFVSLINLLGNPPLLIMVLLFIQGVAIAFFCWQYKELYHRISFVGALWTGFVFAMDWEMTARMVTAWFN